MVEVVSGKAGWDVDGICNDHGRELCRDCALPGAPLPEGMKPWAGGDSAPADWDGGEVLLSTGYLMPLKRNLDEFWRPEDNSILARVIAYTPRADERIVDRPPENATEVIRRHPRHASLRPATAVSEQSADSLERRAPSINAGPKRYLSDRFKWAAPGDQQEDAWLVRFCDRDCGEAVFTGPEAEQEAWAYWERYAPSFNIYVFRLAALAPAVGGEGL